MSAAPEVYRAISAITKEIGREGVSKDRKNAQQGYTFRGIDDVFNALNPLLAHHELCILPRMTERTTDERSTKSGGVLFSVTVKAEYDFVSAKDGSKHTVTMYGEGMDSADKATNKAMSAAYKYACFEAFCIPTEGLMEEADATTPEPAPRPKTEPKAEQKPWSAKFRTMYDALGKTTYSQILGNFGYERANEIPDQQTAKKIIDAMNEAAAQKGAA